MTSTSNDGHPKKRLIICCDGTWQASNHGLKTIPSNIAKLSRAVKTYEKSKNGEFIQQVVYYSAGVGTGTDTAKDLGFLQDQIAWLVKKWEGGVGAGLDENVCEAYNFIANNYIKGDELYFFGFSRGAYTARATAGLVASVGVCSSPMLDTFYKMYDAYRLREKGQLLKDTAWAKTQDGQDWFAKAEQDVLIKVVGVFDTVGSLGYPDTGHVNVEAFNRRFGFHDTNLHPNIEYGFHALALDEHRRPFSPTLWSLPEPVAGQRQTKKLIQCWFPGMHINVGGGNSDQLEDKKKHLTDMEAMANITYAWMLDRVRQYTDLVFDEDQLKEIALRYANAQDELIREGEARRGGKPLYQGWGMGPVADSWEGMKLGGSMTRSPGHYPEKGVTHEYIHPVVAYAKRENAPKHYDSPALTDFDRKPRTDGKKGYNWVKEHKTVPEGWNLEFLLSWLKGRPATARDSGVDVTIPEFVVPAETEKIWIERALMGVSSQKKLRFENQGFQPPDSKKTVVPKEEESTAVKSTRDFIRKLDEDNGVVPEIIMKDGNFSQGGFVETKPTKGAAL